MTGTGRLATGGAAAWLGDGVLKASWTGALDSRRGFLS